jgi:hypothetical protein
MTRQLGPFVWAGVVLWLVPVHADALMEMYLSDPTGDAHQIEIVPGGSFQVEVGLATTQSTFGVSYWLNISENGSGLFSITDRVIPPDCPFPDLITGNNTLLQADVALLDPNDDRDLGALTVSATVPQYAGLFVMAYVTITASPDVPLGTYTLSFAGAAGAGASYEDVPVTGHDYTIVVTDGSSTDTGGGDTGGDNSGDTGNTGTGTGGDSGTGTGGDTGNTGSGTGDTGGGTVDTGGGTSDGTTTDGSTSPDANTGNDGGTSSGSNSGPDGAQTGDQVSETTPRAVGLGGCGAGSGGALAACMLFMMGFVRLTGGRRRN